MNCVAGVYYCVALTGPGDPRWHSPRLHPRQVQAIKRAARGLVRRQRSLQYRDPQWTYTAKLRPRSVVDARI